MYDTSDPRSNLASKVGPGTNSPGSYAAEYVKFYEIDPQEKAADQATWYARGQNFIVAVTEADPGAVLERQNQPDEYVVLLEAPDANIEASANGESVSIPGYSIVMMPPGESTITVPNGGRIVRLFTTQSDDLAAKCANAASYREPHANIPPFQAWPDPVGGFRIRHYSLNVPAEEGRFGRIFRCTTFMVNFFEPQVGQRDTTLLSPHHHDDFEQCSLALQGSYMHHIRWPWTKNMAEWREDNHELCGSPSICVIPPPSIHTSRWLDDGENQLVDIFSPPRIDFSNQEGWVLNASDYPAPGKV